MVPEHCFLFCASVNFSIFNPLSLHEFAHKRCHISVKHYMGRCESLHGVTGHWYIQWWNYVGSNMGPQKKCEKIAIFRVDLWPCLWPSIVIKFLPVTPLYLFYCWYEFGFGVLFTLRVMDQYMTHFFSSICTFFNL